MGPRSSKWDGMEPGSVAYSSVASVEPEREGVRIGDEITQIDLKTRGYRPLLWAPNPALRAILIFWTDSHCL